MMFLRYPTFPLTRQLPHLLLQRCQAPFQLLQSVSLVHSLITFRRFSRSSLLRVPHVPHVSQASAPSAAGLVTRGYGST